MIKFDQWLEQEKFKAWSAKKVDSLKMWRGLPDGIPIIPVKPIPSGHKGSTMSYDGLRITGSSQFINSILSRVKDILNYETDRSNLQIVYKQQIDHSTGWPVQNSFAFYVQIQDKKKDIGEVPYGVP